MSRRVDPYGDCLDDMRLDSFGERSPGEPNDPQHRELDRRLAGLAIDGHPNLMRVLSRQTMEPQGGQQADPAARNQLRRKSKTMVFGDRRTCENMDSPGATFEHAAPFQASQKGNIVFLHERNTVRRGQPRACATHAGCHSRRDGGRSWSRFGVQTRNSPPWRPKQAPLRLLFLA